MAVAKRGRPQNSPSIVTAENGAAEAGHSIEDQIVPKGMVSLYVNVEPGPRGGICFVPTNDNSALPGSVQVCG